MDERYILDMLDHGGDMSDLIDIVGNIIDRLWLHRRIKYFLHNKGEQGNEQKKGYLHNGCGSTCNLLEWMQGN